MKHVPRTAQSIQTVETSRTRSQTSSEEGNLHSNCLSQTSESISGSSLSETLSTSATPEAFATGTSARLACPCSDSCPFDAHETGEFYIMAPTAGNS